MRIGRMLSGGAAALALVAAAGCSCQTQYLYRNPDGTEVLLTQAGTADRAGVRTVLVEKVEKPVVTQTIVVTAPKPAAVQTVVVEKPAKGTSWWTRNNWCVPCEEKESARAQVAGAKAETKVLVVESGRKEADGKTVTVLRRGRKGKVLRALESGQIIRVVEAPAATQTVTVVSEPAIVVPVAEETAEIVVEAVPETVFTESVVVEEPSWAKYLAPEQPVVVDSYPATVTPTAVFLDSGLVPAAPFVLPATGGQQPIVIQPVIQPVLQTGQEVLSGQVQMPVYTADMFLTAPLPLPGAADAPVAAGAPVAALPLYAAPAQLTAAPQFVLASDPAVCGPGQNCFILPEGQLAAGPEVLIPHASGGVTTLAGTDVAGAIIASAAPVLEVPLTVTSSGAQDKYGALGLGLEPARPMERPEVSMPAPLGSTTMPPVAGTDEIENALDVMLGSADPLLK